MRTLALFLLATLPAWADDSATSNAAPADSSTASTDSANGPDLQAQKELLAAKSEQSKLDLEEGEIKKALAQIASDEASKYNNTVLFTKALSGEVFITTDSGESIKLGGIEVGLYSREEIKQWINQTNSVSNKKLAVLATLLNNDLDDGSAQVEKNHLSSLGRYTDTLPSPIVKTMTDADGKFQIIVSSLVDNYYIVAIASRELGLITETDLWIVPANSDSNPYLLNNTNMMNADTIEDVK